MLGGSTSRYILPTRYMIILNVLNIEVVIAGDDEVILEFSMVEILTK